MKPNETGIGYNQRYRTSIEVNVFESVNCVQPASSALASSHSLGSDGECLLQNFSPPGSIERGQLIQQRRHPTFQSAKSISEIIGGNF